MSARDAGYECGGTAYYNEETDTVLTRNHENWREHKVQGKQRHEWDLSEHHAIRTEEEVQSLKRKIPLEGWIYDDGFAGVCKPQGSWHDGEDNTILTGSDVNWQDYKSSLPECVQEALKGCVEVKRQDKPDLKEILQSDTKVLNICSDGSHYNNRGSFGWVM
jgi:hypothetical protein